MASAPVSWIALAVSSSAQDRIGSTRSWRRGAGMHALQFVLLIFGLMVVSPAPFAQQKQAAVAGQANPFREMRDKTVLVISPHPDDDIVGCAGALAFLSGRGNRLTVVYLTAGEKSTLDTHMQPDEFKKIRMEEAAAAYKTLGFPGAEFVWLNYEHRELDSASPREVRERLVEIIRKRKPHIAFALDPGAGYRRYQESDRQIAALLGAEAIRAARWPHEHPKAGAPYSIPEVYFFYTTEPTLKLDISEMYERKLTSLTRLESQFPPTLHHISHGHRGSTPTRLDMAERIRAQTGAPTMEIFRRR